MAKTPTYDDIMKKKGKAVKTALRDYAYNEKMREEEEKEKALEEKALEENKSSENIRDVNRKEQEEYKAPKEKGFWGKLGDVFKGTETRASAWENTKPTPIKGEGVLPGNDYADSSVSTVTATKDVKTDAEAPKGLKQTEPLRGVETTTKDVIDYDIDKATDKAIASLTGKYKRVDPHLRERLPKGIIAAYREGFGTNATPAEIAKAKAKLKDDIAAVEKDEKLSDEEKKEKIAALNEEYNSSYGADDRSNKRSLYYFIADAIAKGLKGFKVAGAQGGGGEVEKPAYQEMLETNLQRGLESYNKRFESEMDSIIGEIKGSQEEKDRIRNTFAELYADESLKPVLQNLSVYNKKRLANILREYGAEVSVGDVAAAAKGAFLLESGTNPETVKNMLSNAGEGAVKLGGLLIGGAK